MQKVLGKMLLQFCFTLVSNTPLSTPVFSYFEESEGVVKGCCLF
jgi:hypothetical protein